jgi:ferric-dicitrate binding protein FerR (iron transport regulator)
MSRTNRAGKPRTVGDTVRHALAQAGPVATNTTAAVRHRVIRSRAWAAPQVERTGQFLQHVAAPKVSAALSSAAHKIEPAQPSRRRRWTKRAGAAGLLAAAGAAAAAVLRKNVKPATGETAEPADDDAVGEDQSLQDIAGT